MHVAALRIKKKRKNENTPYLNAGGMEMSIDSLADKLIELYHISMKKSRINKIMKN